MDLQYRALAGASLFAANVSVQATLEVEGLVILKVDNSDDILDAG